MVEITKDIQWARALQGLSSTQSRMVEERLIRKQVPARTSIFNQGDQGRALLIIHEGRVRLFQRTVDGGEFTTGVWGNGYVIGLISAFLGEQRFLSAESIEATSLTLLRREDLFQMMELIPLFGLNVAKLLALLASNSIKRTVPLALNSASIRLGKVLSSLAQPSNPAQQDGLYVVKGLSQEDLGRMVGASRSWVNQTLSSFEREGLIYRGKGQIIIPEFPKFQRAFDG